MFFLNITVRCISRAKGGGIAVKTCFFIGHRETGERILSVLAQEVERHITEYGVTEFVMGHYGGFDRLAASAVRAAKECHPEITLTLLLPYHLHDQPIPVPEDFDGTFYPPGMETVPKRAAIVRANRYMLEHSSYLIAYVSHPPSGSREVLEAGLRRQRHGLIHVTNLAGWYPI